MAKLYNCKFVKSIKNLILKSQKLNFNLHLVKVHMLGRNNQVDKHSLAEIIK